MIQFTLVIHTNESLIRNNRNITLVINKDTILLFDRGKQKRNVNDMNALDFTTFGNQLKLGFVKKPDIINVSSI